MAKVCNDQIHLQLEDGSDLSPPPLSREGDVAIVLDTRTSGYVNSLSDMLRWFKYISVIVSEFSLLSSV